MLVADFDFDLPPELIAQTPKPRGQSRLLVVDRRAGTWRESSFAALPEILEAGDLLVANDSRVFPARLIGRRDPSGGAAECLLLEQVAADDWLALVHPGQKLKPGARVLFEDAARAPGVRLHAEILERKFFGRRLVRLRVDGAPDVDQAVDALGHTPLPPYIHRPDSDEDRSRYQTVYARERGSIAAPTAGLHFDEMLLGELHAAHVSWSTVTLHVGYGTFKPVRVERAEAHEVDAERFSIPATTVEAVAAARRAHKRVVAVGTTSARALETAVDAEGTLVEGSGVTDLFIRPGHRFRVADSLLTNFHLPRSSLLMLVAAFAGLDLVLAAYRYAVDERFRFYSYGDAMLIV